MTLGRFDFTFIPHDANGTETLLAIVLRRSWVGFGKLDQRGINRATSCATNFFFKRRSVLRNGVTPPNYEISALQGQAFLVTSIYGSLGSCHHFPMP